MIARRLTHAIACAVPVRGASLWLVLGLVVGCLLPPEALAQRPFRISDPFYRNETARRDFFDRYALTAEISYRSVGSLQGDGLPTSGSDLAFRFRFDYELATRLDLGAIFDAVGDNGSRQITLSWLVLKYYRSVDYSNYAFRLAVDPSSDGRVGFPQVDFAFLYTTLFSPVLSTDFALGLRRVNLGYAQFVPPEPIPREGPLVIRPRPMILFTRALGTELHVMMNYNVHLDPAGSNLFLNVLGEAGEYDVVERQLTASPGGAFNVADLSDEAQQEDGREQKTTYQGGTLWARGGFELNRPSYQLSPFVGVPLKQWNPGADEGDWPQARLHFGLQLMLR